MAVALQLIIRRQEHRSGWQNRVIDISQRKWAGAPCGQQMRPAGEQSVSLQEHDNRDRRHQAKRRQHDKVDERLWTDRSMIDARGFGQTEVNNSLLVQSIY